MFRMKALTVCAWASVLFTSLSATAQQVGPRDQRRDWYQLQPRETDLLRYAEANCIAAKYVDLHKINATTYELRTKGWTKRIRYNTDICDGADYLGQQTGGGASAVLVGPNKVLTAKHTVPEKGDCKARWFVFDHFQKGLNNPPVDPTGGAHTITFAAENVYKCKGWTEIPNEDLVVLTLDRNVENGRRPLKINRDGGTLESGTPVVSMGHPQSLPMKIDEGAVVSHASPNALISSSIHAALRTSGSMLVDRTRGVVSGIVAYTANWFICPSDLACCTDNPTWFNTFPRAVDISLAVDYVPQIGLETTPRGLVEMHGPIWGNFTNGSTEYKISTPRDEPGNVAYEVRLDQDSGLFTLNRGTAPISGILAPGEARTFTVETVMLRGFYPIGIHEATISIVDHTYGATDFRKHRLHVGTDSFFVGPEEGFYGAGPGAISGETTNYTINNRYVGSQEIRISTSDSWLHINRMNTPFALYVPGIGQGGTASVQVSLDDTGLPDGLHRGEVTFDSYPFDGTYAVTRAVLFDVGREVYSATSPIHIQTDPTIQHGFSRVELPITLPSGGRLLDIDVEIHLDYQHPPGGGSMLVELESPPIVGAAPITVRLHDSTMTRRVNLNEVFEDLTNPLGTGDSLTSLENIRFQSGDWVLRISHGNGLPMVGSGTLHSASLRVRRSSGNFRPLP